MIRRFGSRTRHLAVLAAYLLLSLLLTWPLAARITTHVPGTAQWAFDESTFLWNLWYFKHSLVDGLRSPLHSELIWYPLGIDLILYTYNFFHALIALPLALAFNLAFAGNVALLASTALSGYGVFLLLRDLFRRQPPAAGGQGAPYTGAAFTAGLVYAFASNRAIYAALGHYDMVTTQWIPFYALMLLRSLDASLAPRRRRKAALLAGFFFALNGLAEMITALFLAIFTLIVLAVWAADGWRAWRAAAASQPPPAVVGWPAGLTSLAITGGVAFLLWSPVLLPILRQFLVDDYALKGWGEAIPLSADLLGWFTPTVLHPLFGGDLVAELRRVQLRALEMGVTGFRDINTVFLGWITLALAVLGALVYRSRLRLWIWTSVVFGLFTLGPFLQINGRYRFDLDGIEATFPLPYALLHYLPIVSANRAPNRNSVLLMLGLAVLAGYGVGWLGSVVRGQAHGRRRLAAAVSGALALLILFEHLAVPAPLSDARIPAVYSQIAADPRPVSVLQLPLGWRNSFGTFGPEQTLLQYYQTAHGKPMLGGNISRAPDFKLDYFQRIPFFRALTAIQFGGAVDPALLDAAREEAEELAYLYDIGYVLLFPPVPDRFPYADHWRAAWTFVKETLPLEDEPFWAEEGIEAYRVEQPAGDDRFALDLGAPGTYPYRGEGWDAAETDAPYDATATWATGTASRLFVPLRGVDPSAVYTVRLRVHPFAYPGSPPQRAELVVNGRVLPAVTLADGWQEVAWEVPGTDLSERLNRLELRWEYAAAPRAVLGGDRRIGGTGVELPVDADLKGFADGAFIALFDEAGGEVNASAGRRGLNLAVLDPQTGAVREMRGFDTAASEAESAALAAFVAGIEPGLPVLVAGYGDAGAALTEEGAAALQSLGIAVTREDLLGHHLAAAGVAGAEPGTAAVVLDPEEAFLRISLNRDRRPLAAAVDWLRVE